MKLVKAVDVEVRPCRGRPWVCALDGFLVE